MARKVYISNGTINLSEYISAQDDPDRYACWGDPDTQSGYNRAMTQTFEAWQRSALTQSRFRATILRLGDGARIGSIFLSPEDTPPDLAIMIYKPYRRQGYGTAAFSLGVQYCFEHLLLERVYAGCYPHNTGSMKMLERCGFLPHPLGNIPEKHYITGESITQLDFVRHRTGDGRQ